MPGGLTHALPPSLARSHLQFTIHSTATFIGRLCYPLYHHLGFTTLLLCRLQFWNLAHSIWKFLFMYLCPQLDWLLQQRQEPCNFNNLSYADLFLALCFWACGRIVLPDTPEVMWLVLANELCEKVICVSPGPEKLTISGRPSRLCCSLGWPAMYRWWLLCQPRTPSGDDEDGEQIPSQSMVQI